MQSEILNNSKEVDFLLINYVTICFSYKKKKRKYKTFNKDFKENLKGCRIH